MKKKLLCVIMAVLMVMLMVMQSTSLVFANAWTDSLDVNVDLELKESESSTYVNGPLDLTGSTANVDIRANLDMGSVFDKFVEWYNTALSVIDNMVKLDMSLDKNELINQLNALKIDGEFIIKIWSPKELTASKDFIDASKKSMYGFNEEAKQIFYEKSRVIDTTSDKNNNILTITVGVTDSVTPANGLLAGELYANKQAYLDNLVLTAENVVVSKPGTYTVKGTMTGSVNTSGNVGSKSTSLLVDYTGVQTLGKENPSDALNISATVKLTKPSTTDSSNKGSGSITVTLPSPGIIFNIDGNTTEVKEILTTGNVNVASLPVPEKKGYTFDGWYLDSEFKNKVTQSINVKSQITLYGHWISDVLDTENHFAYIIGYPDGTVRPEENITREEIATIFYRLLRKDKLADIETEQNSFADVSSDRWSNKAISTLANGGFIQGYENGTFAPEGYITRAEFATMATRFAYLNDKGTAHFSDVAGHWAIDYILKAANAGWIQGYEDGSFRPEKYITRAEAMTIINRVLVRHVDANGLHKDAKVWSDISESDWYYYIVEEATNSHLHTRQADGKTENWIELVK